MERAKKEASRRGTTLTALIEAGLEAVLASSPESSRKPIVLRTCEQGGGPHPGIDLNNNAAILDLMESP